MYLSFYRLKEKPFQINTEPRFLWAGEIHKEALSVLKYGVMSPNGILALTGNVGTGKTMLVNALLADLDENIIAANIVYTEVDLIGFINLVGQAFHLPGPYDRIEEFIVDFRAFLQRQFYANRQVLLIVDEAHKLSLQILEQTRLLTNIEMGGENLFSLFLVGQSELNKKLLAGESQALRQRITLNYQLKALSRTETRDYCNHRLRVAGSTIEIFDQRAIREIYRYSGGYPRRINVICERALVDGYAKGVQNISADIIRECARDLLLPGEKEIRLRPLLTSALGSTLAAVSRHDLVSKTGAVYRQFKQSAPKLRSLFTDRFSEGWFNRPSSLIKPFRKQSVLGFLSGLPDSALGNAALSAGAVLLALVFSFWYQGLFSSGSIPETSKTAALETKATPPDRFESHSAQLTGSNIPARSEELIDFAEPPAKTEPDLTAFFGTKALDSFSTINWNDLLIAQPVNPPKAPPLEVQRTAIEFTAADRQEKSTFGALQSFTKPKGSGYAVQVGAFRSEKNATKVLGKLSEKGYAASIVTFNDTRGRSWYTVRFGKYETLARAREMAAAFSTKEQMKSIALPANRL